MPCLSNLFNSFYNNFSIFGLCKIIRCFTNLFFPLFHKLLILIVKILPSKSCIKYILRTFGSTLTYIHSHEVRLLHFCVCNIARNIPVSSNVSWNDQYNMCNLLCPNDCLSFRITLTQYSIDQAPLFCFFQIMVSNFTTVNLDDYTKIWFSKNIWWENIRNSFRLFGLQYSILPRASEI